MEGGIMAKDRVKMDAIRFDLSRFSKDQGKRGDYKRLRWIIPTALLAHPEVSYIYPCKLFSLDPSPEVGC